MDLMEMAFTPAPQPWGDIPGEQNTPTLLGFLPSCRSQLGTRRHRCAWHAYVSVCVPEGLCACAYVFVTFKCTLLFNSDIQSFQKQWLGESNSFPSL